jgi:hypothetical protein
VEWYKRLVVRSVVSSLTSSSLLTSSTSVKQQATHLLINMRFSIFVSTAVLLQSTLAFPHFTERGRELIKRATCNDGNQQARLFSLPEPLADSSSKKIPGEL